MRGAMCFDFCWYEFTNLEVFVNMAVLCLCSLCAGKHGSFVCVCVCSLSAWHVPHVSLFMVSEVFICCLNLV